MNQKIAPYIVILSLFYGCVSPKVVEEIKTQRQETLIQNQQIKKENNLLSTENTELSAKVDQLTKEIDELIIDSLERSKSCLQLQQQLDDLNEAYDLLTAKNSQMMSAKANETKD